MVDPNYAGDTMARVAGLRHRVGLTLSVNRSVTDGALSQSIKILKICA